MNAQIEFLLRESLRRAGRLPKPDDGQRGRAGDGQRGGKGERGGPRG